MKQLMLCIAIAGASLATQAQDSNWRFFAGLGAASGGEKITSGTITTDGTGQVVPFEVAPGTGIQKRIGFDYRIADRFTLQASIGHSVADPMGYNGSYDFTVVPVELMGFVEVAGGLRIGAGVRKSSAELRGTGLSANSPVNGTFKGDAGSVLELQYLFSNSERKSGKSVPQFGISLRAVNEKFTHALGELNGNHTEVGLAVYY